MYGSYELKFSCVVGWGWDVVLSSVMDLPGLPECNQCFQWF